MQPLCAVVRRRVWSCLARHAHGVTTAARQINHVKSRTGFRHTLACATADATVHGERPPSFIWNWVELGAVVVVGIIGDGCRHWHLAFAHEINVKRRNGEQVNHAMAQESLEMCEFSHTCTTHLAAFGVSYILPVVGAPWQCPSDHNGSNGGAAHRRRAVNAVS